MLTPILARPRLLIPLRCVICSPLKSISFHRPPPHQDPPPNHKLRHLSLRCKVPMVNLVRSASMGCRFPFSMPPLARPSTPCGAAQNWPTQLEYSSCLLRFPIEAGPPLHTQGIPEFLLFPTTWHGSICLSHGLIQPPWEFQFSQKFPYSLDRVPRISEIGS
jgi:hypothetical protein